jgi:hypothetical protein
MALANGKIELWNAALLRAGDSNLIQTGTEQNNPALEICKLRYDEIVRQLLEAAEWPFAAREVALAEVTSQSRAYDGNLTDLEFDIPWWYLSASQLTVQHTPDGGTEVTLTEGTHYTVTQRVGVQQRYITLTAAFTTEYGTMTSDDEIKVTVAFAREGWEYVYALPSDCVKPTALLHNDLRQSLTAPDSRLEFAVLPDDAGETRLLCTNAKVTDDFDVLEYTALVTSVPMWSSHFKDAVIWQLASELADGLQKSPQVSERCLQRADRALSKAVAFERNYESQRALPETESIRARNA